MKTKLLKNLRSRFVIEKRGKEYRIVDACSFERDISITKWDDSNSIINKRKEVILHEARKYKNGKLF